MVIVVFKNWSLARSWVKILYLALGLKRLPTTAIVGALLQYFSPLHWLCLSSNIYSAMRYDNRFCVLLLFDYPCDMDHESD